MVTKLQNNSTAGSLNVDAVVDFFGGRQTLVGDLKKFEIVELHVTAIDKWKSRGNIPAARRDDLQTLARLKKTPFAFSRFRKRAATKKKAA